MGRGCSLDCCIFQFALSMFQILHIDRKYTLCNVSRLLFSGYSFDLLGAMRFGGILKLRKLVAKCEECR